MSDKYIDFLLKTFLFNSMEHDRATDIISKLDYEIKSFSHKESIYTPSQYEKKLGFVVYGDCIVEKLKTDGSTVPLNILRPGDSFGILAVLSGENEYPTQIISSHNSEILFISQKDLISIINSQAPVAMNVITFLTKKIQFLNSKVSTFTSDTVEQKLASYILYEYKKRLTNEFSFNCKKTAETINAGRASLYRAINSLTEAGYIKLEHKKIYILDLNGLERI